MIELDPEIFYTQIEYRGGGRKIILGFIGEFPEGSNNTKKIRRHKSSLDGKTWSKKWVGYTGAITQLLIAHGLDPIQGHKNFIPTPQTFKKTWLPLDYNEIYNPRNELVQEEDS
jgi:hypothetical protein